MNRSIPAIAISVVLLASLSGCFLLPDGPNPRSSSSAKPGEREEAAALAEVGDCWKADTEDLEKPDWRGEDPVDCGDRHQTYTYFVGDINVRIDDAWDGKKPSADLSGRAYSKCSTNLRKLGVPDDAYRVQIYYFVAPKDEWEAGDHSIRCDLGVTAIGTDWNDPGLENLPQKIDTLLDDVEDDPIAYEFCLIGDAYGPYESQEVIIADCSTDYMWRYSEDTYFDTELNDPYLSDEELFGFAESVCTTENARVGEAPLYYVPTLQMWREDYRYVECWYSTIELPKSPV